MSLQPNAGDLMFHLTSDVKDWGLGIQEPHCILLSEPEYLIDQNLQQQIENKCGI